MRKINYISSNKKKYEEARYIAKRFDIALVCVDLKLKEIQSINQKEISLETAKQAFKILKEPLIVDDAGLYLSGYPNFPGSFTKFMLDSLGRESLFKLIMPPHSAVWKCFATYIDESRIYTAAGDLHGLIGKIPSLKNYSYDDIFLVDNKKMSLMTIKEKSEISHRSKAFSKIFNMLSKE